MTLVTSCCAGRQAKRTALAATGPVRQGAVAMHKTIVATSVVLMLSLAGCGTSASSSSDAPHLAAASSVPVAPAQSTSVSPAPIAAATPPASASPSPDANVITLSEWKVSLPSTIKAGKVTFAIDNAGIAEHELIGFRSNLAPGKFPMVKGDVNEDGNGIVQVTDGDNIAPGGAQTRTIDLTKPGTYVFMCNIPGHFQQGMYQVVTVTR